MLPSASLGHFLLTSRSTLSRKRLRNKKKSRVVRFPSGKYYIAMSNEKVCNTSMKMTKQWIRQVMSLTILPAFAVPLARSCANHRHRRILLQIWRLELSLCTLIEHWLMKIFRHHCGPITIISDPRRQILLKSFWYASPISARFSGLATKIQVRSPVQGIELAAERPA